jgi:TBC1 domain family member 13
MRKKGRAAVPEWLNSPMWSAPDPLPAPPDPYGADLAPPPPPPPLKPATPAVPPPPSYAEAVGERGGRRRRGQGVRKEEDEDGGLAESVIRAHLLADFKAAVGFSSRSVG